MCVADREHNLCNIVWCSSWWRNSKKKNIWRLSETDSERELKVMFGADYATYAPYVMRTGNDSPGNDNTCIPEYLIPLFEPPHPWQTSAEHRLNEDFVMVAEFSEIEGPKPMMCIPKDGGLFFNQNDFAVKIMAVDHQTSTIGFSVSEDTQVVISDTDDGVNSFVHHFVLYDIEARGFVRPFCMAYITADKRKIMTFYEQMSTQFKKVARFLKYGNRLVFMQDLERREMDLQYSLGQLRVDPNSTESSNDAGMTEVMSAEDRVYRDLLKIRQAMEEIQVILAILKPLMNDTRMEYRLQTLEEKYNHQENFQHTTDYRETVVLSEQVTDNTDKKPSRCCSWDESSQSSFPLFQQTKSYTPKLVQATKRKRFDSELRTINELCWWGAEDGIKKLRQIQEYYNRETMILEIEQDEMNLLEPPGSLVTCGQCITSNFLTGVTLCSQELSSLSSGPIGAVNMNRSRLSMSDRMSMDSFKSLSSFESFEDDGDMHSVEQMSSSSYNVSDSPKTAAMFEPTTVQKPVLSRLTSCESDSTSSVYQTDEAPSLSEPVRINTNKKQNHAETSLISNNTEISLLTNQLSEPVKINTNKQHNHAETSLISSNNTDISLLTNQLSEPVRINTNKPQNPPETSLISSNNTEMSLLTNQLSEPVRINTNKQQNHETSLISSNNTEISLLTNQNIQMTNKISVIGEHSTHHSTPSSTFSSSQLDEMSSKVVEQTNQAVVSCVEQSNIPESDMSKDFSRVSTDSVTVCEHGNKLNSENLRSCPSCSVSSPSLSNPVTGTEMKRDSNYSSDSPSGELSPETMLEQGEKINEFQDNILNSSEEETACTSSSSSLPTSKKTKNGLFSLGDIINKLEPGMPGHGILNVINTYNNLPHILFSLLTGRTVLVVGSSNMENEVIAVVKALSIFLPDHRRKHSSLVEWLSKPLRITDLGRIKLAGVCRPDKKCLDSVIPSVIKKYVSVFDMERKMLTAPAYQGSLLTVIFNKRKAFSTDAEFVAFIHCWFMEISSKAFIFYHSFCLGSAGSLINDYRLHYQGEHYRNTVKRFMEKLGILDSDVHVIEYLCEIVKMSELEPGMKLINTETGVAVRPISLSYENCQFFRS